MNYVINIGRQFGSGGRLIGETLAKELGIGYYDKELILLASKESGLCKEFFEHADEKSKLSRFLGNFSTGFSSMFNEGYGYDNLLHNDSLFQIQSDVIRHVSEQQSCLFVGRCADYILRNHPRVLNIFLSANEEDRIRMVMEREQISAEKAKELIPKVDKKRAAYYNYYTQKMWGHAFSYHLCINTSILGLEESTNFIRSFAEKKFGL